MTPSQLDEIEMCLRDASICAGLIEWPHADVAELLAEVRRLREALEEIAALRGKCLVGPVEDREGAKEHAKGSNRAYEDAAKLARRALEGER